MVDFDYEVRSRQTHRDPSARVLAGSQNVELFAARPHNQLILYVCVEFFEWSTLSLHWLHGVPTLPVLAYNSNLVLLPRGAQ